MIQDFIYNLEGNQRLITEELDHFLMTFPEFTSKLRWKIPFYFRKSWICYINPLKGDGIEFAFVRANELSNEQGALDFKKRKQIAGISYFSPKEINFELIMVILEEAIILDDTVAYSNRKKK